MPKPASSGHRRTAAAPEACQAGPQPDAHRVRHGRSRLGYGPPCGDAAVRHAVPGAAVVEAVDTTTVGARSRPCSTSPCSATLNAGQTAPPNSPGRGQAHGRPRASGCRSSPGQSPASHDRHRRPDEHRGEPSDDGGRGVRPDPRRVGRGPARAGCPPRPRSHRGVGGATEPASRRTPSSPGSMPRRRQSAVGPTLTAVLDWARTAESITDGSVDAPCSMPGRRRRRVDGGPAAAGRRGRRRRPRRRGGARPGIRLDLEASPRAGSRTGPSP